MKTIAFALLLVACGGASYSSADDFHRTVCYQGCAQQKDACMLEAMNASAIESCDTCSRNCGATCAR